MEDVFVGLDGLSRPRVDLVSVGKETRWRELRPAWKQQARFACNVAVLADVDRDGLPDLAVVEPWETDFPTPSRSGSVMVLTNGLERLYQIGELDALVWNRNTSARAHFEEFGRTILPLGDVDGDGSDDLAIVDPAAFGGISVHSGADGSLLRRWGDDFNAEIGFCHAAARIGDVDGDGHPDLAVTRVSWHTPDIPESVHVLSTGTGEELYELRLDGRVGDDATRRR